MHYLRSFINGCHICQLARSDKSPMTVAPSNLFEIQTTVKIKYGSEGNAYIAKGSQIHLVHH